jgi:hypothetical protein
MYFCLFDAVFIVDHGDAAQNMLVSASDDGTIKLWKYEAGSAEGKE